MDLIEIRRLAAAYGVQPFSNEKISKIERDAVTVSKHPEFILAVHELYEAKRTNLHPDQLLAYYIFLVQRITKENALIKKRVCKMGEAYGIHFTEADIESLSEVTTAKGETVTFSELGGKHIESQLRNHKPAYKKDITPEQVKALYQKLGTQQKVADHLGIDIKTVRNRLRQ